MIASARMRRREGGEHLDEQAQPVAGAAVVVHKDDHGLGRHALHAPVHDADAPGVHRAQLVVRQRLNRQGWPEGSHSCRATQGW